MPPFFLSIPGVVATIGFVVLVVNCVATGRATLRSRGQLLSSLIVLTTSVYVVIARPEAGGDHKWAFGLAGIVVVFWLSVFALPPASRR